MDSQALGYREKGQDWNLGLFYRKTAILQIPSSGRCRFATHGK